MVSRLQEEAADNEVAENKQLKVMTQDR